MIRFCRSGTAAGPISTPRSPRATITPSASARISSSTSTASAFSIFAITRAREPASSISLRRSRTSAAERTNDSATKSTSERERELEVVDVLARQRRDRQRHAGQVHALVRRDQRRRRATAQCTRPCSTSSTCSRISPSSISTSWPGLKHVADHGRADGQRAVGRLLGADERDVARRARARPAPASSPMRSFGPCRSAITADRPADLLLNVRGRAPCGAPCPRACRARSSGGRRPCPRRRVRAACRDRSDAGPIVATIFVRRRRRCSHRSEVSGARGEGDPARDTSPRSPSSSSIRSSWLYFAMRSVRDGEPVLIWPAFVATAMSAIVASSVSPERWETTTP